MRSRFLHSRCWRSRFLSSRFLCSRFLRSQFLHVRFSRSQFLRVLFIAFAIYRDCGFYIRNFLRSRLFAFAHSRFLHWRYLYLRFLRSRFFAFAVFAFAIFAFAVFVFVKFNPCFLEFRTPVKRLFPHMIVLTVEFRIERRPPPRSYFGDKV